MNEEFEDLKAKTWVELIICPECQSTERAEVVHYEGFWWAIYAHICQQCGYAITESEWCTLDDYMFNQEAVAQERATR